MTNWTMIMETKKFHDLPSANWRSRKDSDIIQSGSEGREKVGPWFKSQSEGQRQHNMCPLKWAAGSIKRGNFSFLCFLFYSGPHRIEWSHLYWERQSLDTPKNNVWPGDPVISQADIKLTATVSYCHSNAVYIINLSYLSGLQYNHSFLCS